MLARHLHRNKHSRRSMRATACRQTIHCENHLTAVWPQFVGATTWPWNRSVGMIFGATGTARRAPWILRGSGAKFGKNWPKTTQRFPDRLPSRASPQQGRATARPHDEPLGLIKLTAQSHEITDLRLAPRRQMQWRAVLRLGRRSLRNPRRLYFGWDKM